MRNVFLACTRWNRRFAAAAAVGCAVWLIFAATGGACLADELAISARHHSWGRFQPGAWKVVSVRTETYDDHGALTSTNLAETKTTLRKVDADGVTLEVEVGMEVAGKQFAAQPQCIKQGFHGELLSSDFKAEPSQPGQVVIEGRKIPCRVQKLHFSGESKTLVTVYYSDDVAPYILKRTSATTDLEGKSLGESTMEVDKLNMSWEVLGEMKDVASVTTVQTQGKGSVTTLSMTSPDVPGGVVHHTSKEVDAAGRVTRRSVLELKSFGLQPQEDRGVFGRKRARGRKAAW